MIPDPGTEINNQHQFPTSAQDEAIAAQLQYWPESSESSPESLPESSCESSLESSGLDEAIAQHRKALLLQPGEHSDSISDLEFFALVSALAEESSKDETTVLTDLHEANQLHSFSHLGSALHKRFHLSDNPSDLDEAVSMYRIALSLVPAPHDDRWNFLVYLAKALTCRFRQTDQRPDLEEAISLNHEALRLVPPGHRTRASILISLATAHFRLFQESDQLPAVDEAILLLREYLTSPQSDQLSTLINLAACLRSRFDISGERTDLKEAISLNCEAIDLLPREDSRQSSLLDTLSENVLAPFERSDQLSDLDEAISQLREILGAYPEQSTLLDALARAMRSRFDHADQLADLDEAIGLHREALSLLHPEDCSRPGSLSHLGFALHRRFHRCNNLADLDEAISKHEEALSLLPAHHLDRWDVLDNIVNSSSCRFRQTGQGSDLDKALSRHKEAITLRRPSYGTLSDLAEDLMVRFRHLRQRTDIEQAISMNRQALDLLPGHDPKRSHRLNSLATALYKLFLDSDQVPILDEAIGLLRESLALRQYDPSVVLSNLASCLQSRFEFSSRRVDLEEAISLNREALDLLPHADSRRSFSVDVLCKTLLNRYQHYGQLSDIDEAVSLQREYIIQSDGKIENEEQATLLMTLAKSLQKRYVGSAHDQCADLHEAILFLRKALALLHDHIPLRLAALTTLADVLCARFHHSRDVLYLDEAIALPREVLAQLPPSHPKRSSVLIILSKCLAELYNHSHQLSDLDQSISLRRDILDAYPPSHPDRSHELYNLARLLELRFRHCKQVEDLNKAIAACQETSQTPFLMHGDACVVMHSLGKLLNYRFIHTKRLGDLHDATDAFRVAVSCQSAPVSQRFFAAQSWAACADASNHDSAMEAYTAAIGFMPRLALTLDLQSRQHVMTSGTDGLPRDAAACAIRSGKFNLAVELLEEGRGVFWSQVLQLRNPLSELMSEAPELAQKFKDTSDALEQGSFYNISRNISDTPGAKLEVEKQESKLRRLNEQWLADLQSVRKLNGFEDFLCAKRLSALRMAATNGPVVILNASKSGCAALVLRSTEADVLHVPLTQFSLDTAKALVGRIQKFANALHPQRHMHRLSSGGDDDDIFRNLLATLWTLVVDPILRSLNLKKSTSPPRLWWCPMGVFTSLPIHAAGIYNASGGENVSDFVISSYTPTLSTLLTPVPPTPDNFKMLVVIQPTGLHPLPNTREELHKIEEHVHAEFLIKYGTTETPASIENILLDMAAASIVHLACHGQQSLNPLDSGLILEDGELKVTQLMQLSLQKASLVFLSACETAMGDAKLPDEVLHIATALLFVGFRGAIGTMWSIDDSDGPNVADAFYGHLLSLSTSANTDAPAVPDTIHAARALHFAVAKLRASTKCSFRRWVPFVHLGL